MGEHLGFICRQTGLLAPPSIIQAIELHTARVERGERPEEKDKTPVLSAALPSHFKTH